MSWELVGQIIIFWCLFVIGVTSMIQDIKKPTITELARHGFVKPEGK